MCGVCVFVCLCVSLCLQAFGVCESLSASLSVSLSVSLSASLSVSLYGELVLIDMCSVSVTSHELALYLPYLLAVSPVSSLHISPS